MKDFLQIVQSLIPFLTPYPNWVKIVVVAWVLLGVCVFAALLFSLQAKVPSVASTNPPVDAQRAESTIRNSMQEYFSTQERLHGRFLEKEEFVAKFVGQTVHWAGYVGHVASSKPSGNLSLVLQLRKGSGSSAIVFFGKDFRTKLFSLHEGDEVRVVGTFDGETALTPTINAISIDLINE